MNAPGGVGTAVPLESFAKYHREEPTRPPDLTGDYLVPLLQSGVTAVAAGLVTSVIAYLRGWSYIAPLSVIAIVFALAWWLLLRRTFDSQMTREHVVNEPRPVAHELPKRTIRLEIREDKRVQRVELPIDEDMLCTVARAVLHGRAFSHSSLTDRGQPLTRGEFEALRDWLLTSGYARWSDESNRRAGVTFTAKGNALLRGLAG